MKRIDDWESMFSAWVKYQAGLPSDIPLWPNPTWSQDVAMVAHALAAPKPLSGVDFLQTWMRTPNPMLGDNAPLDMLKMGKGDRLALFIQEAYEAQAELQKYRKVECKSELRDCRMCGGAAEMWQRLESAPDVWHAFVCCATLEGVDGQPCDYHLPESAAFYRARKVDAASYWNLIMGPRKTDEAVQLRARIASLEGQVAGYRQACEEAPKRLGVETPPGSSIEHRVGEVVFRFIDRLEDQTPEDNAEKIVAEMLELLGPVLTTHFDAKFAAHPESTSPEENNT